MRGLIVGAALLVLTAASAHAAPRMELTSKSWDFGEIFQWTNPSITIGISNAGDETLSITDVKVSCGCTATFLSSKEIKPGDKGFIRIDFASYTVTGKVNKLVRLVTNDPAAPQTDIAVRGLVREDKGAVAELDKDYVDIGVVAPYETRYIEFLINNRGNVDLDIRDLELPNGYFLDSAFPNLAKVRSGIAVRVGYRPPVEKGPINDVIRVKTTGINGGQLELKVAGYVDQVSKGADDLVVTPTGFTAETSGGRKLVLSVKNAGNTAVTLEGVDCSLDTTGMELSTQEVAPGEVGTVRLDISPAGLSPGTKGYVYLRLGLPVEVR